MPKKSNKDTSPIEIVSNDDTNKSNTNEDIDLIKLSQIIKSKRSSKGWDINKLSNVSSIPVATIIEYESGNIALADTKIISKLEAVLGKLTKDKMKGSKPKRINKKRKEKKAAQAERNNLFQSSRSNTGYNAFK